MNKVLLNVKETAEVLGLGRDKTYQIMKLESFPKVFNGNRIMAIASELDNWVKAHKGGQI